MAASHSTVSGSKVFQRTEGRVWTASFVRLRSLNLPIGLKEFRWKGHGQICMLEPSLWQPVVDGQKEEDGVWGEAQSYSSD